MLHKRHKAHIKQTRHSNSSYGQQSPVIYTE